MDDFRFDPNPNLEHDLRHSNELRAATLDIAKAIAAKAIAIAPAVTGHYRDGIRSEQSGSGARVIAGDNKSAWVEFGVPSHNEPPQFVLRRAAEAVGVPFVKKRG